MNLLFSATKIGKREDTAVVFCQVFYKVWKYERILATNGADFPMGSKRAYRNCQTGITCIVLPYLFKYAANIQKFRFAMERFNEKFLFEIETSVLSAAVLVYPPTITYVTRDETKVIV
jgi:hypothetical protein